MNKTTVMAELKQLGTDAARKTYARHNVPEPFFGVRYGDLYKLQKKIGIDHALAEKLWATGNHDARILATLIADPEAIAASTLDEWVKACCNQLMVDAIASIAAPSRTAPARARKWIKSRNEWIAATGWHLIASLAARPDAMAEEDFAAYIEHIEHAIDESPNRVRHSMNTALIGIGIRSATLQRLALATAKRIGPVEVDHGDTQCKTPDAHAYILKVVEHQRGKKAGKKSGKKTGTKTGSKKKSSRRTTTSKTRSR